MDFIIIILGFLMNFSEAIILDLKKMIQYDGQDRGFLKNFISLFFEFSKALILDF